MNAETPRSSPALDTLADLETAIHACAECPRLRQWCGQVAATKVKRHQDAIYWGKPVAGFGDPKARLFILGLAPGAHGANRTGRVFTGDESGRWLYDALHRHGFANRASSEHRDDGLVLKDAYISNVVRCAPPQNKPTPAEIANCRPHLQRELQLLRRIRVVLCLGNLALQEYKRILRDAGKSVKSLVFKHGAAHEIDANTPLVLTSYHPSQQNTFTGKLTKEMWHAIFATARERIGS